MVVPCKCASHKCGGRLVSKKTLKRHAQDDFNSLLKKAHTQNEQRAEVDEADCPRLEGYEYPESMYQTHWAANTPLYGEARITVLDYIFLEMLKFTSHPSYAKETVTENCRQDKHHKLPLDNKCPLSFTSAKNMIKDFLVPLESYDVCPKDCVIYRKDLEYTEAPAWYRDLKMNAPKE